MLTRFVPYKRRDEITYFQTCKDNHFFANNHIFLHKMQESHANTRFAAYGELRIGTKTVLRRQALPAAATHNLNNPLLHHKAAGTSLVRTQVRCNRSTLDLGGIGLGGFGSVRLGSITFRRLGLFLTMLGHKYVVKAMLGVEFVQIHITRDAADTSCLGMLP